MNLFSLVTSLKPDSSVEFTSTLVVAGIGIVLATLALLIVIFNAFGIVIYFLQSKKEKKKEAPSNINDERAYPDISEMKIEEPPLPEDDFVPPEVIAAISAAVYMLDGENAKVTSVKRKREPRLSRNAWAQAAVFDNTRPF